MGWRSGEQGGIDNMGKDIDRNITKQLWERLKNAFTRNDVIPIENGGTGATNSQNVISNLTNNTKYIDLIRNSYKNDKINKIIDSYIHVNTNSMYLYIAGNYTVTNDDNHIPLILAVFKNAPIFKNVKLNAVFNSERATIDIDNGTITISIRPTATVENISLDQYKTFFTFPL